MKNTLIAALLITAATLAQAESFASSASSAATTGVSASSKSINTSSESSSGEDKKVAAGLYQVTAVVAVPDAPGITRLALKGEQGQAAFTLDLPAGTVEAQALVVGGSVLVQERAFGYAFALPTAPQQPFFLALAQGWEAEMQSKRVAL